MRCIGVLLWVMVLVSGCRTASPPESHDIPPPVRPILKLEFQRGGLNIAARFETLRDTTSPLHHFVFSIDTLRAVLQIRGRAHYDTVLVLPQISGTTGIREKIDSISVEGFDRWSNPLGIPLDTVRYRLELTTLQRQRYAVTFDTVLALPADSTLPYVSVTPFIDVRTDSTITFALLAQRHRGFGEDYYPTSERMRVEIFDDKGQLRFSSNYQLDFMQAIAPVEPKFRGDVKRFTFEWPGVDNTGEPLPPGHYVARLSLVTKPYPYSAQIEFEWQGKQR